MIEKWYQNPSLPFYKPAYSSPYWLNALNTAYYDIYSFHLHVQDGSLSFSFDYYGEKIALRVSHTPKDSWNFELHIPALTSPYAQKTAPDTVCLLYQAPRDVYQSLLRRVFTCPSAQGTHLLWQSPLPSDFTAWGFYLGELAAYESRET